MLNIGQRNLTLKGKIIIFKTLALSKITFLADVLVIPNQIINGLQQIQKDFLWNSSSPKVKYETICKDFQYGGLRNIDIKSKIISLQCSWIKKLHDQSFHEWKITPLTLIKIHSENVLFFTLTLTLMFPLIRFLGFT